MKAMTQITFLILSNSLLDEINRDDTLHKQDVENKLEQFKAAHGLLYAHEWEEFALTSETVCKGIAQFIDEEEDSLDDFEVKQDDEQDFKLD